MLARLPPFVRDDDGDYGPNFEILEARGGWLRIADAGDSYRPPERPRRRLFAGTGWVEGRWVRVGSQSSTGHAEPSANATVLVSLGEEWLIYPLVRGVLDCGGGWALLGYRLTPATPATGAHSGEAWFTHICAEQRTTCDGTPPP